MDGTPAALRRNRSRITRSVEDPSPRPGEQRGDNVRPVEMDESGNELGAASVGGSGGSRAGGHGVGFGGMVGDDVDAQLVLSGTSDLSIDGVDSDLSLIHI